MKFKILLIFLVFSCSFYAQTKDKKYAMRQVTSSDGVFISGLWCFKNSFEFNSEKIISNKQDSLIKKLRIRSLITRTYNKNITRSFERIYKKNKNNHIYQSYLEFDNKGNLLRNHKDGFVSRSSLQEISYKYDLKGIIKGKKIEEMKFCVSEMKNDFYKRVEKDRRICGVSNKQISLKYDSLNRIKRIKILEKENEITKNFNYSLDTTTVVSSDLKGEFLERVDNFFRNDTIKEIHSFSIRKNVESLSKTENSSVDELFFNTNNKLLKKISLNRSKYNNPYSKDLVFKSRRTSFYNYNNDVLQEKRETFSSNNTKNNCSCTVKYSYNTFGLIDKIENEVTVANSKKKSTATTTFEYEFYKK